MLGLFSNKSAKIEDHISNGAIILDVRSPQEYSSGHVQGSQNVPLNKLAQKVEKIKKLNKPVITCCASGMRSGSAARTLRNHGIDAINGGPWTSVQSKVSNS